MKILASIIGFFLNFFFQKRNEYRLGKAEQQIHDYEMRDRAQKAMDDAPKVTEKSELIDKLKNGSLAVLMAFFFVLLRRRAHRGLPQSQNVDARTTSANGF